MQKFLLLTLAAAGLFTISGRAQVTVLDNLNAASLYPSQLTRAPIRSSATTSPIGYTSYAQPFHTPDAGTYELVNVTLGLGATFGAPGGGFTVQLMQGDEHAGSFAFAPLVTLTGVTNPTTAGNYTFAAGDFTLRPDTTYWIVLSSTSTAHNTGAYEWAFFNPVASTPNETYMTTAEWAPVDAFASSADGSIWTIHLDDPAVAGGNAKPYLYAVSVNAIPEPSAYALFAGALGLALVIRQRVRVKGRATSAS